MHATVAASSIATPENGSDESIERMLPYIREGEAAEALVVTAASSNDVPQTSPGALSACW